MVKLFSAVYLWLLVVLLIALGIASGDQMDLMISCLAAVLSNTVLTWLFLYSLQFQ